jgi:MoaA/NifB/PqqE/SkfB family radical SAM enzyme
MKATPSGAIRAFRRLGASSALALAAAALQRSRKAARPGSQIFLGLTYKCNAACRHCRYSGPGWPRSRGDMPARLAVSALEQARAIGIERAVFFGGEPLLYKGLAALVGKASKLGFITQLDTNGALLKPARLRELKRAGLACAMISLHGASSRAHDAVAGRGSFDRAAEAVRLCAASGLLTYVSVCVFNGRAQAARLRGLFALARRLGAHGARLLPFSGPGGPDARSNRAILALTRDARAGGFARTCLRSPSSCDASRGEIVYVAPSGSVTRCPYSPLPAGNLRTAALASILAAEAGKKPGIFC